MNIFVSCDNFSSGSLNTVTHDDPSILVFISSF